MAGFCQKNATVKHSYSWIISSRHMICITDQISCFVGLLQISIKQWSIIKPNFKLSKLLHEINVKQTRFYHIKCSGIIESRKLIMDVIMAPCIYQNPWNLIWWCNIGSLTKYHFNNFKLTWWNLNSNHVIKRFQAAHNY